MSEGTQVTAKGKQDKLEDIVHYTLHIRRSESQLQFQSVPIDWHMHFLPLMLSVSTTSNHFAHSIAAKISCISVSVTTGEE